MRIFKNTWFTRFADKEGITDAELRETVYQLESGLVDSSLGGAVYKVRIARSGGGKAGGYRVIIFFRSGDLAFFTYGFAKSNRGNISEKELRNLKKQSASLLSMSEAQIKAAINERVLIEV